MGRIFRVFLLPTKKSTVVKHLAACMALEGGHRGDLICSNRICFSVACQKLVVILHSHPDFIRVWSFPLVAQFRKVKVVYRPEVGGYEESLKYLARSSAAPPRYFAAACSKSWLVALPDSMDRKDGQRSDSLPAMSEAELGQLVSDWLLLRVAALLRAELEACSRSTRYTISSLPGWVMQRCCARWAEVRRGGARGELSLVLGGQGG